MKKKIPSLLLITIMLLTLISLIPQTALAAETYTLRTESNPSCFDTCQIAVSSVLMNYELSTGSVMNITVATVDPNGKVTAVSDSHCAIIATADGSSGVCSIGVNKETSLDNTDLDDSEGNNDDNVSDTGDDSPEPTAKTSDTVIITIMASDLPEGTTAVKLQNGEIIELDSSETIQVEVSSENISDDGTVELTALDDEGIPLGEYKTAKVVAIPNANSAWHGIWPVLLVIAGISVAGLAIYLIMKKRPSA